MLARIPTLSKLNIPSVGGGNFNLEDAVYRVRVRARGVHAGAAPLAP
jgi:hypothetical protein